ncbi:hypothetical protein Lser_V15G18100 [Lactuca serriola]
MPSQLVSTPQEQRYLLDTTNPSGYLIFIALVEISNNIQPSKETRKDNQYHIINCLFSKSYRDACYKVQFSKDRNYLWRIMKEAEVIRRGKEEMRLLMTVEVQIIGLSILESSSISSFQEGGDTQEALGVIGKMFGTQPRAFRFSGTKDKRAEDRRARLQAQFSQMRPIAMAPVVAPHMPIYPPGGPGLGQQIFYGQAQRTFIPPHLDLGINNYSCQVCVQVAPQCQTSSCQWCSKVNRTPNAATDDATWEDVPLPPGRNVPDGSITGIGGGGMVSVPYDIGGMALRDTGITQHIPIGALDSALANASPTEQRTVYAAVVKHLETVAGTEITSIKEEEGSMILDPMDGDILLVSDIII